MIRSWFFHLYFFFWSGESMERNCDWPSFEATLVACYGSHRSELAMASAFIRKIRWRGRNTGFCSALDISGKMRAQIHFFWCGNEVCSRLQAHWKVWKQTYRWYVGCGALQNSRQFRQGLTRYCTKVIYRTFLMQTSFGVCHYMRFVSSEWTHNRCSAISQRYQIWYDWIWLYLPRGVLNLQFVDCKYITMSSKVLNPLLAGSSL